MHERSYLHASSHIVIYSCMSRWTALGVPISPFNSLLRASFRFSSFSTLFSATFSLISLTDKTCICRLNTGIVYDPALLLRKLRWEGRCRRDRVRRDSDERVVELTRLPDRFFLSAGVLLLCVLLTKNGSVKVGAELPRLCPLVPSFLPHPVLLVG